MDPVDGGAVASASQRVQVARERGSEREMASEKERERERKSERARWRAR